MAITISGGKISSTLLPTASKPAAPAPIKQLQSYQAPVPTVSRGTPTPTTNSNGGSGGGSTPVQSGGGAPQIPQPQAPSIDFDALIQPALDALDSAIAPLQTQEANTETGITQNAATATDTANQNINQQTSTINAAQKQQSQNEQSASDAARRQYAEIQQGLQARYGGSTGTGAFATEQAGTQTLRSLSDIKTAAANAQTHLTDSLTQVQTAGATLLKQIQDQASQQISQAKNNLDLQLADIRNQKGQLLAHKADLASSAMQQYQATVNQVNTANAQFAQQLYAQQKAAEQSLQAGLDKAGAIASAATPQDLMNLVNQFKDSGVTPTVTQKLSGGGSITLSPTAAGNNPNDILAQLGLQ